MNISWFPGLFAVFQTRSFGSRFQFSVFHEYGTVASATKPATLTTKLDHQAKLQAAQCQYRRIGNCPWDDFVVPQFHYRHYPHPVARK
jgi:hypothetical protein